MPPSRLPKLSFVFVFFALVALTIVPIVTAWRVGNLRSTTDNAQRPAWILGELRDLFSEEIIHLQSFFLTGGQESLANYRETRARQELLLQEFGSIAREEDVEGLGYHRQLREMADRWHELPDAWLAGSMTEAEFVAQVPQMLPVRDSLLDLSAAAERAIESQITAFEAAGVRIVITQLGLALTLGILGVLAAIIVARAASQERKLTHALAHAVEQESRARDLADRRHRELQVVSESKGRLTRGFSHDVKNPLGAADGYLALLEQGVPEPVPPAQSVFVQKARRSIAAALNLIEDLLEIERASTGNIEIKRAAADLSEIVHEAVDEYRVQAEEKGLIIEMDLPTEIPVIATDGVRVRQVVGNLISNAVKYTPSGRVCVRMARRVDPESPESDERIAIEVADTGVGIPREKKHLLFQEFTRFEPGAAKGTGIGLAISYRIAQALGGDLRFESTSGTGSRFTLWLPTSGAAPEAEEPIPAPPVSGLTSPESGCSH